MDDRIRAHSLYHGVWENVLAAKAKDQLKTMKIFDTITAEVSDKERVIAGKAPRAPMFVSKSSTVKIDNRGTYHETYLCADAAELKDTVVHVRGIIDNGSPGGTCQNTNTVRQHLLVNTILRVFVGCAHKVEMSC